MQKVVIALLALLASGALAEEPTQSNDTKPEVEDLQTSKTAENEATPIKKAKSEKHHDDPTKVVTKFSLGYTGEVKVSGSVGLDDARMLNASVYGDGGEWTLGGSWLFDIGIVNFYFSNSEYDDGSSNTSYSIGTFVPLSYFGIEPAGWQIFPMFGYNYSDGDSMQEVYDPQKKVSEYVLMPTQSHGGYLGGFAFKPINETWSVMTFAGGSMGSEDYRNYWVGGGVSYAFTHNQSINLYATYDDSTLYEADSTVGLSYKIEFD
ncbi:hypothetical protein [Vibrio paucivorans]|uniref:Outer membrane protein beta-barrel domain-containing protein n=1 Tax=Vibrio paucivorans TaxID=2829489 RepID=A0A9X3HPT8_9VIBR|nr:hypothetical protein [Vibrio paucivorans]MCW8332859.1 hypothetical protein [Vibrio paucivorans]